MKRGDRKNDMRFIDPRTPTATVLMSSLPETAVFGNKGGCFLYLT
jgi:hypothetical protein